MMRHKMWFDVNVRAGGRWREHDSVQRYVHRSHTVSVILTQQQTSDTELGGGEGINDPTAQRNIIYAKFD